MAEMQDYLSLTESHATSPTAAALRERAARTYANAPRFFSPARFATLRAVAGRLVPGTAADPAGAIDAMHADGRADDGWRYDAMPPDAVALNRGLDYIDSAARERFGRPFASASAAEQDEVIAAIADGRTAWVDLDASLLFVELLAAVVEAHVGHPATLAAMGVSAPLFAPRWTDVGLNATQAWEPKTP